jgi:N6-adenosine-specific RNA methylase IME4
MNTYLPAVPEPGAPLTAGQVAGIEERIADALAGVSDPDLLMEWRAKAAALETYLRGRDLQGPMLGAQRRTEGRIGQLLPPEQGRRADLGKQLPKGVEEVSRRLDDMQKRDFRILARALSGELTLAPEQWRRSRAALTAFIRTELGLKPPTPPLPEGRYACIVADPPWQLDTGPKAFGGVIESGHDHLSYDQEPLENIAALDVKSLAADDAHLYLWTTNRYLRDSYYIAEQWGFKPSVVLTWCKTPRGVGLGDTFRLTTEFVLFARRGNLPHIQIVPTTWFDWPRGKHSEKPTEFYQLVESVTPGPYVDLFARRDRPGWRVWGDEAP